MQLIFEKSVEGRHGLKLVKTDVPERARMPSKFVRSEAPELPQVSELDVVRHFTGLSQMNFSVDGNLYPLGSCTMKYNPKFTEKVASIESFMEHHPLLPQLYGGGILAQGSLEILYRMEQLLCEITGMAAFTMQPLAGAHGELTGTMLVAAYHRDQGSRRKHIIVPDSSHGTNPASAATAGYDVVVLRTDRHGCMDLEEFKSRLSEDTAAVMLTCPNTLGLFNPHIKEIADIAHSAGALMYYDGANFNAILGKCRPGDLGFDVIHLNLHKTFATPHGGGGPGSGPVGVAERLADYLPVSRVIRRRDGTFALDYNKPKSIGYIAPFYGNYAVVLKALAYTMLLGKTGLTRVSEYAVLNANYCLARLKEHYGLPFDRHCMHECVLSGSPMAENGVHALDIAKYLIDRGVHPPTVYFPLIVKEALMIEPTECESKATLDEFIEIMIEAAELAETDPERLTNAPQSAPVGRLDETKIARGLNLRWTPERG